MLTSRAKPMVFVMILTLIAAFGVACAAEAPAPVPAEEIAAMVKEAVKESVPAAPAAAPAGPSAAEIRSMMQEAVAAAAPAAIDPNEIRRMVETAVKAGPGVSKEELTATIKAQMGEQMTAADVKKVVDSAIAAMPAPKIDTAAIRPLVEQAVVAAAPKGVSSAEIGAMVEAAVTAATKDVPSRGELEASITKSVTEAAAGQLTAAEVQNIVAASLVATERAIGEATKAAQDAQMAAKEAGKEAMAARTEAAAVKAVVAEAPKVPEVRYVPKQQVAGVYWDFKYDGPRPTTFSESPELTKLVKAGLLPPVEERLPVPEDVLIRSMPDEIGVYGGTWRVTYRGVVFPGYFGALHKRENGNGEEWLPDVVKNWNLSEDGRVYTYSLRRGAKWSDGAPMTTEDWRFAWEDLSNNPDLGRAVPSNRDVDPVTAKVQTFKLIDDYTFSFSFENPNFRALEGDHWPSPYWGKFGWAWYAPAHYMKQFHQKYADPDELAALVKEEEVDDWIQLFRLKLDYGHAFLEEGFGAPMMSAWVPCERTETHARACRNAFYYGVDPEGNQLPYIDSVYSVAVESNEVALLRAMLGESDLVSRLFQIQHMPLLVKNMEKGDYSIYHWKNAASDAMLAISQTYNEDPEIGRLLRTKDFRIALSLGIDREGINNTVYAGLGLISNFLPFPNHPYYPPDGDELSYLDATFDIPRAKQILDDLGIVDTDGDGFRNRIGDLTGNKGNLELFAEYAPRGRGDDNLNVVRLVQDTWAQMGIKFEFKLNPSAYTNIANETLYFDFSEGGNRGGADPPNPWYTGNTFAAGYSNNDVAPSIGVCMSTRGAAGHCKGVDTSYLPLAAPGNYPADPTGQIQKMQEVWIEGAQHPQYSPGRIEAAHELYRLHAQNKFQINIVNGAGAARSLVLKRNNFRNVPITNGTTRLIGYWPALYYFEDGIDNMTNPGNRSRRYKSVNYVGGE